MFRVPSPKGWGGVEGQSLSLSVFIQRCVKWFLHVWIFPPLCCQREEACLLLPTCHFRKDLQKFSQLSRNDFTQLCSLRQHYEHHKIKLREKLLMEVGMVLKLGPVVSAIVAALLVVFLPDLDPLPVVVTRITLPENVSCLPLFRLMANFRLNDNPHRWQYCHFKIVWHNTNCPSFNKQL